MKHFFVKLSLLMIALMSAPLLAFFAVMSIGTLVNHKTVVTGEKRAAINFEDIVFSPIDNRLQSDLEDRMADQLFGRDFFMKIATAIDKMGDKFFYGTQIRIGNDYVRVVDSGRHVIINDLWYFPIKHRFDINAFKTPFNQTMQMFNDIDITLLAVPNFGQQGAMFAHEEDVWDEYIDYFEKKDLEYSNFHLKDLTFKNDFDSYKKYMLRNDHHEKMRFDKLVYDYVTTNEGVSPNVSFSDEEYKTDIQYSHKGLFNEAPKSPRLPEDYFVNRIVGFKSSDYDSHKFTLNHSGDSTETKIELTPMKELTEVSTIKDFDPNYFPAGNTYFTEDSENKTQIATRSRGYHIKTINKTKKVLFITNSFLAGSLLPIASGFSDFYSISHFETPLESLHLFLKKNGITNMYIYSFDEENVLKILTKLGKSI